MALFFCVRDISSSISLICTLKHTIQDHVVMSEGRVEEAAVKGESGGVATRRDEGVASRGQLCFGASWGGTYLLSRRHLACVACFGWGVVGGPAGFWCVRAVALVELAGRSETLSEVVERE